MAFFSKLFDREEKPQHEYLRYLRFRPTYVDCIFSYTKPGKGNDLEYSLDNGASWHSLAPSTNVLVRYNDTIMWRGKIKPNVMTNFEVDNDATIYTYNPSNGIGVIPISKRDNVSNDNKVVGSGSVHFTASSKFEAKGNPASILVGDDVGNITDLSNYNGVNYKGAFIGMFRKQTNLVSAEDMFLSFDTLSDDCFAFMFSGCTNLVKAPVLNSMNLSKWCYAYMFSYNINLIGIDTLPALTLYKRSYFAMFANCHYLQKATQIAATKLDVESCALMFMETAWFDKYHPVNLGYDENDRLPAVNLAYGCYAFMFAWSAIKHYPMLPAEKLEEKCYYCFGYQRIPYGYTQPVVPFSPTTFSVMAIDRSATDCLFKWLGHESSPFNQNINFYYNNNTTAWGTDRNGLQVNGTVPSIWTQQVYKPQM